MLDWFQGGLQHEERPELMTSEGWIWLFTVADMRWVDPDHVHDYIYFRGTGFNGLNEFDLENAVKTTLEQHGVTTKVEYVYPHGEEL